MDCGGDKAGEVGRVETKDLNQHVSLTTKKHFSRTLEKQQHTTYAMNPIPDIT